MNQSTIDRLNQINHNFYQQAGPYWNNKPDYFWVGWVPLVKYLNKLRDALNRPIRVLDLGCGNGRFYNFLISENLKIDYTGVDFSNYLLNILEFEDKNDFRLIEADLIKDNWKDKLTCDYDFISLFGVFHHIPGKQNRLRLIQVATNLLSKNGLLTFTFWRYDQIDRLQKRIISKITPEGRQIYQSLQINPENLEKGDSILNWVKGVNSYRYAHAFNKVEAREMLKSTKLNLVENYLNDGRGQDRNEYFVLGN